MNTLYFQSSFQIAACTALREVLQRITNLRDFKTLSIQFPSTNTDVFDFMHQLTNGEHQIVGRPHYLQLTDEILEVSNL
jgi:hypothetical protein